MNSDTDRGEFHTSVRDHGKQRPSNEFALRLSTILLLGACIGLSSPASADPCNAADNGTGTVTLPPIGCDYLSPDEVHVIIDGLPPGTTIESRRSNSRSIRSGRSFGTRYTRTSAAANSSGM